MRLPVFAALCLCSLLIGASTAQALFESGWHLSRGMRPADGTIIPKLTPIHLQSGMLDASGDSNVTWLSGATTPRLRNQAATPQLVYGRDGGLERTIAAQPWQGKRVRLTLRLENRDGARAFFVAQVNRTDGPATRTAAQINESGDDVWQTQEVVMDVPANARDLFLYAGLVGTGTVWIGKPVLEAVGNDVALTPAAPVGAGGPIPCTSNCSTYYGASGYNGYNGGSSDYSGYNLPVQVPSPVGTGVINR